MKTSVIALGLTALLMAGHVQAAGDVAAGKVKSALCEACHGKDGNGTQPIYPRLAGQHASYIVQALEAYKSGDRKNPIMAGFAAALDDADRANLAAYYASLKGLSSIDVQDMAK
ncbi:MAG: cytochrome c [Chromatiales bacterium]|mgnify:CR=1 FL=1|nr:cytochrome c [Chromatiales bacterium]